MSVQAPNRYSIYNIKNKSYSYKNAWKPKAYNFTIDSQHPSPHKHINHHHVTQSKH